MSHRIEAFIGYRSDLRSHFDVCAALEGGLVLVPLGAVATPLDGEKPIAPFLALTPSILAAMRSRVSSNCVLGYIETEYFGGTGEQRGGAWRGDSVVVSPQLTDGVVNRVLSALGVVCANGKDEWDTVGLVRSRSTEAIVRAPKSSLR